MRASGTRGTAPGQSPESPETGGEAGGAAGPPQLTPAPQVQLLAWSSLRPRCSLGLEPAVLAPGAASLLLREPLPPLLARCGNCTRRACLVQVQLWAGAAARGPPNHLFLSPLKDAEGLRPPRITVSGAPVGSPRGCFAEGLPFTAQLGGLSGSFHVGPFRPRRG